MCAWCRYTRGRFERAHEDVWSGHTGFSACHTPHRHTHQTANRREDKTQHTTTHHNNTTTTPHENRERETEKEDGDRKRREKREERREKIHFQCGGAWRFFVHGVLCLIKPVNDRVFSLLSRVKYDCSLISFSASWPVNSFFYISAIYLFYAVTVFIFCDFLVVQLQFHFFLNYLVMHLHFFLPEFILHKYSVEGYPPMHIGSSLNPELCH